MTSPVAVVMLMALATRRFDRWTIDTRIAEQLPYLVSSLVKGETQSVMLAPACVFAWRGFLFFSVDLCSQARVILWASACVSRGNAYLDSTVQSTDNSPAYALR